MLPHGTRALLLLLFAAHSAAQPVEVYRSVDAHGNPSFSDRPPADAPSERLAIDASAPPPSPEVAERRAEMSRVADELRAARQGREASAAQETAQAPGAWANAPPPEPVVTRDYWMPYWYPPVSRPRPPLAWPRPPETAPPIPRPNPDSASPRGLRERLRRAR